MQLTMHIGTEKTGTTTIQTFLAKNRATLKDLGVFVPVSLGPSNHRRLPAIANDPDFIDDFFMSLGLRDRGEREEAKRKWWDEFVEELKSENPKRVVVSSEHLQSRLMKEGEIERLGGLLKNIFTKIDIVLYIRSPLEGAISLYSTAIKNGATDEEIPSPANPYFNNIANHRRTIERWGRVFGADSIKLRIFEPECFTGGNLIDDFIDVADIPKASFEHPVRENESLNRTGLALLRRLNVRVPKFTKDGRLNPSRFGLVAHFEKNFGRGPKYVPPQSIQDAYIVEFADSNEWVRKNYFPERVSLFRKGEVNDVTNDALAHEELDQIVALLSTFWIAISNKRKGGN